MKHVINGKVTPSGTGASKAKSKAVLLMDPDDVSDGLQLGDFVQMVVTDSQQRLALADRKKHNERAAEGAEPR